MRQHLNHLLSTGLTAGLLVITALALTIAGPAAADDSPQPTPQPPDFIIPGATLYRFTPDEGPGDHWAPLGGSGMEQCQGGALYTSFPPKCLNADGELITVEPGYGWLWRPGMRVVPRR